MSVNGGVANLNGAIVCSYPISCFISAISGLPEKDIIAGSIGAFISLAFIKPHHWSDWINYKPQKQLKKEIVAWLKRTFLIGFILFSIVILMVALVQVFHNAPEFQRYKHIDTRLLSLLSCAGGQATVPLIFNYLFRKSAKQ